MYTFISRSLKVLPVVAIAFFCANTAFAQFNDPPIAVAGADIQANEGDFVTIDGTRSRDVDGPLPITYQWAQTAGPNALSISGADTAQPQVQVPYVGGAGGVMTFRLTVFDGATDRTGYSTDIMNIVIAPKINNPPTASLIAPTTVSGGAPGVLLDGSNSFDPDGDAITYAWEQYAGPTVALNLVDPAKPTFAAPNVTTTLSFRLIVSDGQYNSIATASISVVRVNQAPVVDAGEDHNASVDSAVTLQGVASDADGDALTHHWTQLSGTSVTLVDANTLNASFTAPNVAGQLVFELSVSDGEATVTDTVTVTVEAVDAVPECANARANIYQLWPTNRAMARVKIRGLRALHFREPGERDGEDDADDPDEDMDRIWVRVTGITQDEPTSGTGRGDDPVDALVQSNRPNGNLRVRDLIMLRKERSDSGDGRVYEISFTATNEVSGLSCQGKVQVCVPTQKGKKGKCVNSGQNFNSLQ